MFDEVQNLDYYEHLFTFFKNVDLKDFNPLEIPMTDAKRKMCTSLAPNNILQWLEQWNTIDNNGFTLNQLYDEYTSYCVENASQIASIWVFTRAISQYFTATREKQSDTKVRKYYLI